MKRKKDKTIYKSEYQYASVCCDMYIVEYKADIETDYRWSKIESVWLEAKHKHKLTTELY